MTSTLIITGIKVFDILEIDWSWNYIILELKTTDNSPNWWILIFFIFLIFTCQMKNLYYSRGSFHKGKAGIVNLYRCKEAGKWQPSRLAPDFTHTADEQRRRRRTTSPNYVTLSCTIRCHPLQLWYLRRYELSVYVLATRSSRAKDEAAPQYNGVRTMARQVKHRENEQHVLVSLAPSRYQG